MTIKLRVYFWLVWMLLGGISALLGAENEGSWPQWRGPERDGRYAGKTWPQAINKENFKQAWHIKLAPSYSSPVADKEMVYTTESLPSGKEQVTAYHRNTGDLAWSQSWEGSMKVPFFAASNGSWIRSTPALADGKMFVLGMQERLVCLDTKTGKKLWEMDIPKTLQTPEPAFGGVSSPMMINGSLYVQAGGGIIKLDTSSGNLVWTSRLSNDAMNQSPFASPRLHSFEGKKQIISLGRTSLAGIDPQNGELLWEQEVPAFRGMNILTPTFVGKGILTATYGGKTHLFTPEQNPDKDWTITESWNQKFQGYMSNPVIIDGHAYLHGRSGRMVCLNTETGEINWTSKESLGKYCSMIFQENRILALSNDGKLRLLSANPNAYEVLSSLKISEEDTWAHIAMTDRQIFIRSLNSLTTWQWQDSIAHSDRTVAISSQK